MGLTGFDWVRLRRNGFSLMFGDSGRAIVLPTVVRADWRIEKWRRRRGRGADVNGAAERAVVFSPPPCRCCDAMRSSRLQSIHVDRRHSRRRARFFFHFYLFSFFGSYRVVYRISLAHVDLTDVPPFSFLFLLCVCVCVCFSQVRKTVRKGIDWWSDVLHARDNATARWAPPSCSWAREKKNKKQNKTWYSTSFFSGFPSSRTGFRWSLPGFGLFFRVLLGSSDTEGALDLGAFDLNSARRCRCVAISSRRPRSRNQTFWWEPPILPFLFCFF